MKNKILGVKKNDEIILNTSEDDVYLVESVEYVEAIFSILRSNNIDTQLHEQSDKYITLLVDNIKAPLLVQLLNAGIIGVRAERGYLGKTYIVIEF